MSNSQAADHSRQTAAVSSNPAARAPLAQQYRAIGISAVAAAARYPADKRRPIPAPLYTREQD
jgi:hypothetical protein